MNRYDPCLRECVFNRYESFVHTCEIAEMDMYKEGIVIWKSSLVFDQRIFPFYLDSFLYSLQLQSVQKAAISSK